MLPSIFSLDSDEFIPPFLPLPAELRKLEKAYGYGVFHFRVLQEIQRYLENYSETRQNPPQALNVELKPGKISIPSWVNDDNDKFLFEWWLTLQIYRWRAYLERTQAMEPHPLVGVRIELPESKESSEPSPQQNIMKHAIPRLLRMTFRNAEEDESCTIITPIPRESVLTISRSLELIHPKERRSINRQPYFIGLSTRDNDWGLIDGKQYPFISERHARLDWDGMYCWLQNIGSHEVWIGREELWEKVLRGRPIRLEPGNEFYLGRLTTSGPIPGCAQFRYHAE